MICETCGNKTSEQEGSALTGDQLRSAVKSGFEPGAHAFVRVPLVVQEHGLTRTQLLDYWNVFILGPSSQTWFLCHTCGMKARLAIHKARRGSAAK